MNRFVLFFAALFSLAAVAASAQKSSLVLVSAPLLIDQKTDIPGHTLDAGSYSIQIVDYLKDRFILRVENNQGEPLATFIGLHNPDFDPFTTLKHQGPIFYTAGPKKGEKAVRGFSFPNGNTLEFVYPKLEAVALAKANIDTVPAIDPESEGRKPDPKLSPEDREVVTLWMLSSTRVGPKDETPAIAAKRFVAPAEVAESAPPAAAQPPAPSPAPVAQPRVVRPAPVQIAKVEPAPRIHSAVKKLPQTASELPLLFLLSLLSLSSAATLRLLRTKA